MNIWLFNVQSALLPTACLLCDAPSGVVANLCDACATELPRNPCACPTCARPLPKTVVCPACQSNPTPYTYTHSAFRYASPVTDLIHLMKFKHRLDAAHTLGCLLAHHLMQVLDEYPQRIIPVPLHRSRLRDRGYNQAIELGRPVAKQLGVPMNARAIQRIRATPPQTALSGRKDRQQNVKEAFQVSGSIGNLSHVAIVDDVITTTSTVAELAKVLRRAGVKRVDVWSCARAESH